MRSFDAIPFRIRCHSLAVDMVYGVCKRYQISTSVSLYLCLALALISREKERENESVWAYYLYVYSQNLAI